ncbi:MAG: hypothetical protein Q4D38_02575 [Planctomycetia bacterium]|nr:hypothetical protein [Planctomycetia bacterium]
MRSYTCGGFCAATARNRDRRSPDFKTIHVGSPSFEILPNGTWLASHGWLGKNSPGNMTLVFESADKGATWTQVAIILRMRSAMMFYANVGLGDRLGQWRRERLAQMHRHSSVERQWKNVVGSARFQDRTALWKGGPNDSPNHLELRASPFVLGSKEF